MRIKIISILIFFDKSQYKTIIEDIIFKKNGYTGQWKNVDLFFQDQEIQDQLQWMYDKFLKMNDKSVYDYRKVFGLMTPKTKNKNKSYVKKILEKAIKENEKYGVYSIIEYCDKELINKNFEDILQVIVNHQMSNVSEVVMFWSCCNSEVQIDKYKEFQKIISENAGKENNNYIYSFFAKSKEEVQALLLESLIEEFRDNRNNLNLEIANEILFGKKQNVKFPDKYCQEIFTTYKEINDLNTINNCVKIWYRIGENIQKSNLISMLGSVSDDKFRKLWNSSSLDVQKELYDEVVNNIEDTRPNLKHYFKGEAYIEMLMNMPKEDYKDFLSNNISNFVNALKEKYNVKDEENL